MQMPDVQGTGQARHAFKDLFPPRAFLEAVAGKNRGTLRFDLVCLNHFQSQINFPKHWNARVWTRQWLHVRKLRHMFKMPARDKCYLTDQ